MKKTLITLTALLLLIALASSCATVGKDFPVDSVTKIQIGTTTRADINRMFGTPWRTGIEDGEKTWTYGYYKYRALGESTTRDLVIRFDQSDKVSSYSFNTSEIEE